jgi:hypothetical protein
MAGWRRWRCLSTNEPKSTNDPFHQAIRGMKRRLMDILVSYSNLPEARGEVEMSVKACVFKLIECVVHTRKWVDIFTRNFIKATVVNAQTK